MIFGKANAADRLDLVDLRIAYIEEDNGGIAEDMREQLKTNLPGYFEKHLNRDLFVFTAKEETILSCAFLVITEKPPNIGFITGKIGTVYNVYTVPAYQRQGLASGVMQELLNEAERLGPDYVDLKATKDGYHLYNGLGFEESVSEYRYMKKFFCRRS